MKVIGNLQGNKIFISNNKALLFPFQKPLTFDEVQQQLDLGILMETMKIGDQIIDTWDSYTCPIDLVHYATVDGKKTAYFNWHYAIANDAAFDAPESIYYAENGLSAGTYHIPITANYGTGWVSGQNIQFTLTKNIPAGGQIYIECSTSNANNPTAGRTLTTYAVKGSTTILETTTTSNGTSGTALEAMNNTVKPNGNTNSAQRIVYGYGRWSQSAIRQYLNSALTKGNWWEPQNNWDRPIAQASTLDGFLSKCSEQFINNIKEVPVVTALNTVEGFTDTYETTYDKIFLPSLQEMYINPQLADVEGLGWEYNHQLAIKAGLTGRFAYSTYEILKKYSISNTANAVYVRLRSAIRSYASYPWYVTSSGYVTYSYACSPSRACPACVLQSA